MIARALLIGLLTLPAFNLLAQPQASTEFLGVNERSPYSFIRLTVRNPSSDKSTFDILITDFQNQGELTLRDQTLQSGEERIYNLALPFVRSSYVQLQERGGQRINAGSANYSNNLVFLNICGLERWASEKEMDDFSKAFLTRPPSSSRERVVSQIEPRSLPDNWLCYTPFTAVFCKEAAYNQISASARVALLTWVNSGGELVVYGSDKNKDEPSMLGRIRYQSESPITPNASDIPSAWRQDKEEWKRFYGSIPRPASNRGSSYRQGSQTNNFPYSAGKAGGRVGAFVLTTIFLILAGPVNYIYMKRKMKLRMLLVSLPAISMIFCFLMVLFFLATQGFAKRGGSFSLTLLDEPNGAALTLARHSLLSGLYPLGGFQFSPETAFVPLQPPNDFSIEMTKNLHVRSGIFIPTTDFQYLTVTPFNTREKLIYDAEAQTVINGFETAVRGLVLEDRGAFYTAEKLSPGAKAALRKLPEEEVSKFAAVAGPDRLALFFSDRFVEPREREFLGGRFWPLASPALKSAQTRYLVRLEKNISSVQSGTEIRGNHKCCLIAGVMQDSGS